MMPEKTYILTIEEHNGEAAIRFPPELLAELNAREGDEITVVTDKDGLLLKPRPIGGA
jgi:antitoxin component of MazEF toxin-antitoxin module